MRSFILLFICLFYPFSALKAQNCDFLNDIAVRCINARIDPENFKMIPGCKDSLLFDSIQIKKEFVQAILSESDFSNQLVMFFRFRILKGITHEEVYRQIESFDVLSLMLPLAMDDTEEKKMYQSEKSRLYEVYLLNENLHSGKIKLEDCYSILFDNFFYDNQNMGDDNFINSTFQYTLGRNPTEFELQNGKKMLNNIPTSLFFKNGSSKQDYLKIITSNANFYEYQVKFWHYYFLSEIPSEQKTVEILQSIKDSGKPISIESILKHLLIYIV